MELWRELIDLEHSNMTRSGEWLELVKRKAERLDAAKKGDVSENGIKYVKPLAWPPLSQTIIFKKPP